MVVACFEGWSKQGVFRSFSDMAGDERLLQIVKGQLEKELCSSQWGTHMIQTGFKPSLYLANTLLLMYVKCGTLVEARKVFDQLIRSDTILDNALIDMYAKCGSIKHACQVFDNMAERNVVSWNVMIAGLAQHNMYAKCGSVESARQVFDQMPNRNVVSWNAMIGGYAAHGQCEEAFGIFNQMHHQGVKPDIITFLNIVKSMYSKCGSIEDAWQVFNRMRTRNVISWTAMIEGYVEHGLCEEALGVFDDMQSRDVVSWNAIIGGYAQHGYGEDAFNLYRQMKGEDVCVGNALIDMYTKSGNIEGACRVFDQMPARDVVSWNAMIGGYAQHGYGNKALELFKQMKTEGFKPDRITFVNVLSACNHAGLVDEGHRHFSSMDQDYKVMPTLDHYCCMVDLLGRTGCLQEAEDFIQRMPFEPDASIWSPLLGACHRYGKVEVVEHVADWTLKLDSQDAAVYVLLSNMY
ncbi:unnamed protein product, partial [Sphagnum balticum]